MQGQDNQIRRMFSHASRAMDSVEIADYCNMMGWTSDPVIAVLVDRLLSQEESASLAQAVQKHNDKLHKKTNAFFKKITHHGQATPRPGPQEKYRPVILAILKRQGPLKRSDLVKKVLLIRPSAGKGAVYRSIASAKKDRKIIAIGNDFYYPKLNSLI